MQHFRSKGKLPLLCLRSHRVDSQLIFNYNKSDLLMINKVSIPVGERANVSEYFTRPGVLPGGLPLHGDAYT